MRRFFHILRTTLSAAGLLLAAALTANAQTGTTLAAGDLAFIGYNVYSTDAFTVLLLRNIDSGTVITFTDYGWSRSLGGFDVSPRFNIGCSGCSGAGDSTLRWTAGSALSYGTKITFSGFNTNGPGTASTGTLDPVGRMTLPTTGDQLFAYQGPTSNPTLIAGIQFNYNAQTYDAVTHWDTGTRTSLQQYSALPPALVNGSTALAVLRPSNASTTSAFWGNAIYNCARITGNSCSLRSAIDTIDGRNWTAANTSTYSPPNPSCSFTLGSTPNNPPCSSGLPVTLGRVEAVAVEGGYRVRWAVYEETNLHRYELERSGDGAHFQPVTTVLPKAAQGGEAAYEVLDRQPAAGRVYYRVVAYEYGGDASYSQTVTLTAPAPADWTCYPNPARDAVCVQSPETGVVFCLKNAAGQVLRRGSVANGSLRFDLADLAPGLYLLSDDRPAGRTVKLTKL